MEEHEQKDARENFSKNLRKETGTELLTPVLIEVSETNSVLRYFRRIRQQRKEQEFKYKLKYGKQWKQHAYPHKYTTSSGAG